MTLKFLHLNNCQVHTLHFPSRRTRKFTGIIINCLRDKLWHCGIAQHIMKGVIPIAVAYEKCKGLLVVFVSFHCQGPFTYDDGIITRTRRGCGFL